MRNLEWGGQKIGEYETRQTDRQTESKRGIDEMEWFNIF